LREAVELDQRRRGLFRAHCRQTIVIQVLDCDPNSGQRVRRSWSTMRGAWLQDSAFWRTSSAVSRSRGNCARSWQLLRRRLVRPVVPTSRRPQSRQDANRLRAVAQRYQHQSLLALYLNSQVSPIRALARVELSVPRAFARTFRALRAQRERYRSTLMNAPTVRPWQTDGHLRQLETPCDVTGKRIERASRSSLVSRMSRLGRTVVSPRFGGPALREHGPAQQQTGCCR
jgi:hypothetical protein